MSSEKAVKARKGFKLTKNWIIMIVLVSVLALFVASCATVKAVTKNPGVGVLDRYISAAKSQNVNKMASVLYPKGSAEYKAFVSDYKQGKKDYKSFAKKSSALEIDKFESQLEDLDAEPLDRGLRLAVEQDLAKNIKDYTYSIISQDSDQVVFSVKFDTKKTFKSSDVPAKYSDYLSTSGVTAELTLKVKRDPKTKKWMFASDFRLVSGQENVMTWTAPYNSDGAEIKHVFNDDIEGGVYDLTMFDENIVSIGRYAFENCTSLEKLIIPNGLVNISDYAFKGCKNLVDIVDESGNKIGVDSNITLGEGAFWGCELFESDAAAQRFDFPKINKNIPNYLFYGVMSMSNITIPEDAEIIGHYAFYNCGSLAFVNIPDSVRTIGDSAFEGCDTLASFRTASDGVRENTLTDNITRIGSNVFRDCKQLTSVVLPSNLTEIDAGMFDGCIELVSVELPAGLKSIGARAFKNTGITEIEFPAALEKMGKEAFAGSKVAKVDWLLEGGKTKIRTVGEKAFNGCKELVSITLPASVKGVGAEAFVGCTNMRSVMVDFDHTAAVGESAFTLSDGIPKIYVKDELNTFKQKWFTMRLDLYSQSIITADGEFAIMNEERFDADGNKLSDEKVLVQYLGSKSTVSIDTSVTRIGDGAFSHLSGLEKILNFGDLELTDVGRDVFVGCEKMIESGFDTYGTVVTGQLKYLGRWLIDGNDVDDGVLDLTSSKYYAKNSDGSVKPLPDTVGIAAGAFANLKNDIIKAIFSKNVKYICDGAFAQIGELKTIEFETGSAIERIGNDAFYSCQSLDNVTLPDSFVELGERAFQFCDSLRFVVFNSEKSVLFGSDAFTVNYATPKIYIKNYATNSVYADIAKTFAGSYDTRSESAEAEWNQRVAYISDVIFDISVIHSSGNYATKDGVLLQMLNFNDAPFVTPEGITVIGAGAFAKSQLVEVTIRAGVKRVEEYAFYECESLMGVTFETTGDTSTLEYIGTHAFRGTTQIAEHEDAFIKFMAEKPFANFATGDDPFDSDSINRKIIVNTRDEYERVGFWEENRHMLNAIDDPAIIIKVDVNVSADEIYENTTSIGVSEDGNIYQEAPGTKISVSAIADETNGFRFVAWHKNGTLLSDDETIEIEYGVSDADDIEYKAIFTRIEAWVNVEIQGITADGLPAGSVYRDSDLTEEILGDNKFSTATDSTFTLYAEPLEDCHFVGWFILDEDGETLIPVTGAVGDNYSMEFDMEYKDRTIIARFAVDY